MPTATNVSLLAYEYETLVEEANHVPTDERRTRLAELLVSTSDWTPQTAATLLDLAEQHGSFILRNALALALALQIEDGALKR
jgi:hypothetical protein